jgi:Protein of unknown function, DUF547
MIKQLLLFPLLFFCMYTKGQSSSPAVRYSELLLFAIRDDQPVEQLLKELQQYKYEDLLSELSEDKHKKSFWINIYNAFVQIGLSKKTGWKQVEQNFFKEKIVHVAGNTYQLSTIEKIFLRQGKTGLDSFDYRVHFALNKGTISSPAIVVYDSENIDVFLDIATNYYLKTFVHMDEEGLEVEVPVIFKKSVSDFGGKKKIIELLRKNEVVFMNVTPQLEYKQYDRTIKLKNFLPAGMLKR